MQLAKTTLIALGLAAWIAGFAAHKTGLAQQNPPDASTTTLGTLEIPITVSQK